MAAPNWIELAEIVSGRIANRKDVEWKLAVEHYGAIALSVYAAATYLTPFLKSAPTVIYWLGGILLFISFLTSLLWILLTESAHATDALLYRAYMDLANGLTTESVADFRKLQNSWELPKKTENNKPCEWIAAKWATVKNDQLAWFIVHVSISVIVHVGVTMMLYSLTLPPSLIRDSFPFAPEILNSSSHI